MFYFIYILMILACAPYMGRDAAAVYSLFVLSIWIFSHKVNRERAYGFIRSIRRRRQCDEYRADPSGAPYRSGMSILRPLAWMTGAVTAVGMATPWLPGYVTIPAFMVMVVCLLLIKTSPDASPNE